MVEHVDPDVVALMAMSDPEVSSRDRAHIFACDECREEYERLSHIVKLARSTPILDELSAPRPAVWDRIAAAVHETGAHETAAPGDSEQTTRLAALARTRHGVRRRARMRRRTVPLTVTSIVAAIALILGIGGGLAVFGTRQAPPDPVVAATTLQAFPAWPTARGEAKVESSAAGQRELVVTLDAAPTSEGAFREVWIMSPSLKKLISLGVLVGHSGRFAMPAGVSMDDYPVVDVSEQPDNGNPAHSGNSIARGTLS